MKDAAGPLIKWLKQRPYTVSALDYGCGKLRYTPHVAARSKELGIADSTVQLDRIQRLGGRTTSVQQYARKRWPACRIYDLTQFWQGISHFYDFILCSNVLSAIPSPKIRAMSLRSLHASLSPNGTLLVTNQHTNSYFGEARQSPNAFDHLDGWVLRSRNGSAAAYYGILNKDSTIKMLVQFGFSIIEAWIEGQSNYVLVKRGKA